MNYKINKYVLAAFYSLFLSISIFNTDSIAMKEDFNNKNSAQDSQENSKENSKENSNELSGKKRKHEEAFSPDNCLKDEKDSSGENKDKRRKEEEDNAKKIENANNIFNLALNKRDPELIKAAIKEGANPNLEKRDANIILILACKKRDPELAKFAIKKGANPNLEKRDANIILILACKKGDPELAKFAIKKGANPNLKEKNGCTGILHYACDSGSLDLVKYLIEETSAKDDINPGNRLWDSTPLINACDKNYIEIVRFLLKHGAYSEIYLASDSYLETAFHIACSNNNLELLKLLLEYDGENGTNNIDDLDEEAKRPQDLTTDQNIKNIIELVRSFKNIKNYENKIDEDKIKFILDQRNLDQQNNTDNFGFFIRMLCNSLLMKLKMKLETQENDSFLDKIISEHLFTKLFNTFKKSDYFEEIKNHMRIYKLGKNENIEKFLLEYTKENFDFYENLNNKIGGKKINPNAVLNEFEMCNIFCKAKN